MNTLYDHDIRYLESLPSCPERTAQIAALEHAKMYSAPFSEAYESERDEPEAGRTNGQAKS